MTKTNDAAMEAFSRLARSAKKNSQRSVSAAGLREKIWMPSWWALLSLSIVLIAISVGVGVVNGQTPSSASTPRIVSRPQAATSSPQAKPTEAKVHVIGAVNKPGLVSLESGARVADAIERAGGPSEKADLQQINLARAVNDGEQIRVPRQGETLVEEGGEGEGGQQSTQGAGQGEGGGQKVNINTASAQELQQLPGIGPALSERIIAHRKQHGRFSSVDDLDDVSGIGPAILDKIKDHARV